MAITRKELLKELMPGINHLFQQTYAEFNKRYGEEKKQIVGDKLKRVDNHEYKTEAKDLPIETCVSFWTIKYGDGTVPAVETREQDELMWEIGNRLWWANRLKYNEQMDEYEVIA
jgi:hypothetical protein